jgi:hypothetical protein
MAKLQFNARKDSVVRPRRVGAVVAEEPAMSEQEASAGGASEASTPAPVAAVPDATVRDAGDHSGPTVDDAHGGSRPERWEHALTHSVDVAPAKPVKQTSITLPSPLWQQMQELTGELAAGGRVVGPHELLIAVLRYHAPATVESAAELFDTYLELPGDLQHVGADTEERNVKLPQEVRRRLTEQAQVLRSVTRDASRGALIAAVWQLHGPRTEGEAKELLTGLRRADLDAALTAAT